MNMTIYLPEKVIITGAARVDKSLCPPKLKLVHVSVLYECSATSFTHVESKDVLTSFSNYY